MLVKVFYFLCIIQLLLYMNNYKSIKDLGLNIRLAFYPYSHTHTHTH